jgi:hypothetical protein
MRYVLFLVLAGCFDGGSIAPCVVTCSDNSDCPDDLTCSPEGRCSPGHACPCEANTVLRCNDATSAQVCAPDGASSVAVECESSCVSDDQAPHCRHVTPQFTPSVCNTPTTRAELVVTGTVSSDDDTVCTHVISQGADAPEICVIRANRISIGMPDLVGKRVFAFVSDGDLVVDRLLVYAVRATPGPGASGRARGAPPALDFAFGGDGAPFARTAGHGGGRFIDPSADQFPTTTFYGGHSGASEGLVSGGGGGGGVMLTSCQGTVNVGRKIDAGGGGGGGGRSSVAGAGGGSGGRILIQGMDVVLQPTAGLWANGGGGGGGVMSGQPGIAGADALPEARAAFGGGTGVNIGGDGGFLNTNALNGGAGTGMGTQGGGGGSVGVIEIAVTPTATFVLSTTAVSPTPSVSKTLPVR